MCISCVPGVQAEHLQRLCNCWPGNSSADVGSAAYAAACADL